MNYENYPEKWQERFRFFDDNGAPGAPGYKEKIKALKAEKGFWKALGISMNFYAFFFGVFYMIAMGLWKKSIVLILVTLAFSAIALVLQVLIGLPVCFAGLAGAALCGLVTNYSWYLKEVKNENGWNPFEGMRL